jgi:hypothetical protein
MCEINLCHKSRWDTVGFDPSTPEVVAESYTTFSFQQSIALPTALWALVVLLGLACYVTLNSHLPVCTHIITCTYACECMIAKSMNMANLGYHMHLVLYFRVLIRSSFGRVCKHINYTYIGHCLWLIKEDRLRYYCSNWKHIAITVKPKNVDIPWETAK